MLLIDEDLANDLAEAFKTLRDNPNHSGMCLRELRAGMLSSASVAWVRDVVEAVLQEQGFVQLRGLSIDDNQAVLRGWALLFGEIHHDTDAPLGVVPAEVSPNQPLMGNQLRALPLHTDYSMLEKPPWLTISLCQRSDEQFDLGGVSVVDVESLWYGLNASEEFRKLSETMFPFAAMSSDAVTAIHRPIITFSDNQFLVRYHRSRIVQGFRCAGTEPTPLQAELLMSFEAHVAQHQHRLEIHRCDLTIIDNHRMLHGRDRCSLTLTSTMTTIGRQMLFAFVHRESNEKT